MIQWYRLLAIQLSYLGMEFSLKISNSCVPLQTNIFVVVRYIISARPLRTIRTRCILAEVSRPTWLAPSKWCGGVIAGLILGIGQVRSAST